MKIKGWKKSPQNGMEKYVDKTKKQENEKKQRKAKWKILGVVAAVIFLWPSNNSQGPNFSFGNRTGGGNQFAMTGDMVTASGVTGVGVTEESFDVENLTTRLDIVEVYVTSEEVITEGTKILKISEESIAEARAELEQTLKEADLAYRAGLIDYEQSKITAEYATNTGECSLKIVVTLPL